MKYYLLLFAVLTIISVSAQDDNSGNNESTSDEEAYHYSVSPDEVSHKTGYATEPIQPQRFDAAKWKQVVGDEDYMEVRPSSRKRRGGVDSINSSSRGKKRLKQSDDDDEYDEADSDPGSSFSIPASPILNIIVYALVIAIIGYILFLIFKNISLKSKTKISKTESTDPSAPVTDIKELEIDRLLREAMAAGNYRLAIRIYFLGLLKKLDEDGHIIWKNDKTNHDYLLELYKKAHFFEEVKSLTLVYEQVWYGDHVFPVQIYEDIISSFKTIDQKLSTSKEQ